MILNLYLSLMLFRNKLECLTLAKIFSIVQYLQVRHDPSLIQHSNNRPLALTINNRLSLKCFSGPNALAYFERALVTKNERFIE
jgi:hypothetical protein